MKAECILTLSLNIYRTNSSQEVATEMAEIIKSVEGTAKRGVADYNHFDSL